MADYSQYNGKKVTVVRNPADSSDAVEIEGTVQVGNEQGLLIKPKGKTSFDLIPAEEIEEVRIAPEKSKKLTAKTLKVVELGSARSHLLERHGLSLTDANNVTEEEAFEAHEATDHSDLGHVHGDKNATPRAEAVASEG